MPAAGKTKTAIKPRLWFVCPTLGAKSEVWLYRQATGFHRFDVQIVTNQHVNPQIYPVPQKQLKLVPRPQMPRGLKWRRYLAMARNIRYGCFPGSSEELKWWLNELQNDTPDIIFCQYGTVGARLLPLAREFQVPLVAQFNGSDLASALNRFGYRRRLQSTLHRFSGCVAVATYQRERLLNYGANPSRIRIIPYGVPVRAFGQSKATLNPKCRFLAVGRFVPKKAPDLTIRAFAKCAEEIPNCELQMIGNGPLLSACRDLSRELGVQEKISFHGEQPFERVKSAMLQASVFVQHSLTAANGDMEGWPVAIAEACACGLPVIATRHAGIIDQVVERSTGFLVAEGEWQLMSDRMIRLAKDAHLRYQMGSAARRHIENFDQLVQVETLENFLLDCMSDA